ncbi:MAG: cysteine desulfurase [Verrucomicrobia bacterium]|nr:cysteine desulfurase [Verrucomicrobiota bacterium]
MREDFPMLQTEVHGRPLIYLDSAATSQKPRAVIDAIAKFYASQYGTVHRAVYSSSVTAGELYAASRKKVKNFIHANHEEEIIFTKGTTDGINLVAHSFGKAFVRPGDEILISEMEHHSNIVPWQLMCEDRGAIIRVIPMSDAGELDLEAYQSLLSERTKMVAVTHVSNALGTINPVKQMIAMAHAAGAKVLVDGAQSVPHMPVDVQELDADFYAFSGHKMLGPTGIGCLFGKRALLDAMPPYQGGGDMIDRVSFEKTTYNTLPLKFEAGTPAIAQVVGLGAAVDYLSSIGMQAIRTREEELFAEVWPHVVDIPGIKVLGSAKERAAIITFTVQDVHPLDIATLLDVQGIAVRSGHLCVQPIMRRFGISAAVRASIAFYNTGEELHFFCKALREVIAHCS